MTTDFKKTLDCYRAKQGEFRMLEVPPMQYLMLDGHGDPNTPAFGEAIEHLYPVAYGVKFASKRELERDYVVPPLEGLWWADDMAAFTTTRDKTRWHWTLMLMVPEWIDGEMFERAVESASAKRAPSIRDIRLETVEEGRCVQLLHVGAFDDEGGVLPQLHEEFIPAHGLRMRGRHHEIYLSDFRRVAAERRRTILRQPVEDA